MAVPARPRGRSLIAAKMARAWLDSRLGRAGTRRAVPGRNGPGPAGLGVGSDPTAASGESRGEEAADAEVEQAAPRLPYQHTSAHSKHIVCVRVGNASACISFCVYTGGCVSAHSYASKAQGRERCARECLVCSHTWTLARTHAPTPRHDSRRLLERKKGGARTRRDRRETLSLAATAPRHPAPTRRGLDNLSRSALSMYSFHQHFHTRHTQIQN